MAVKRQQFEIAVAGQRAKARLFTPEGEPRPGVVMYTDIFGIRPVTEGMAERLASEGFSVLLPNIFFRSGDPPFFTESQKEGEERMKRIQQLRERLTPQMQLEDARVYTGFLAAQEGVRPGAMGVVGYCFSGAMAVRTAAACPERIRAAASFHGGNLYTDQPDSPHLLLSRIKAALYFGHAVEDKSMPAEAIEKLGAALRGWGGRYVNKTYEGALHGWTKSDFPVYNKAQAEAAFSALTDFLRGALE